MAFPQNHTPALPPGPPGAGIPKFVVVASSKTDNTPSPPLDIVAKRNHYQHYPNLFREYTHLSDRQKEILQALKSTVPDGYCSQINGADFAQALCPFERDLDVPFPHDGIVNKFATFMLNMLNACESGGVGGDACRMDAVLRAAVNDVVVMPYNQQFIEHLLGLTLAIKWHGLGPFLCRGNPESGRGIFAEIAKEWKKCFDRDPSVYNLSDDADAGDIQEFAKDCCKGVQDILKKVHETHGEHATKYNFNYIRIPRPSRANNAKTNENANPPLSNSITSSSDKRKTTVDGDTSKRKKNKPSLEEATALIERINSINGVSENKVFDSCPTIRLKIKSFLERDGMTKKIMCSMALGNINHNSLNRFSSAKDQKQSGNSTYKNAYVFFEKMRILEDEPKSSERLSNEERMEDGFDYSKPKGGRPDQLA